MHRYCYQTCKLNADWTADSYMFESWMLIGQQVVIKVSKLNADWISDKEGSVLIVILILLAVLQNTDELNVIKVTRSYRCFSVHLIHLFICVYTSLGHKCRSTLDRTSPLLPASRLSNTSAIYPCAGPEPWSFSGEWRRFAHLGSTVLDWATSKEGNSSARQPGRVYTLYPCYWRRETGRRIRRDCAPRRWKRK